MINTEDKLAWCKAGEEAELQFVESHELCGWDIQINPNKTHDKYTHDMVGRVPMDLKSIGTRFNTSEKKYGIPTEWAVTVNEKDLVRYSELYPNILILLDVAWHEKVWLLTVPRARSLIAAGAAKKHEYLKRKDDKDGNAKHSYVFDLRDLDEITKWGGR